VAWIGRALGWGRARFTGGSAGRLLVAGAAVTLGVTALATGAALGVVAVTSTLGWIGVALEALALKSTFSLRGLAESALGVRDALGRADLAAARTAVGRDLVSRGTSALDAGQVASATIESVAENLTDAFVAPLLFFAAFGLPGAVAYRAINTADAMIGYRDGALLYFGRMAAQLDDAFNLVPARLSALLIVAAAAIAGAGGGRAFAVMRRDRVRTASPNAGWTMSAMAGALAVTLAKPGHYALGDGALPAPADISRAVHLLALAASLALPPALALSLVVR
jgi:adenosylcobinamide-phosphate synthase